MMGRVSERLDCSEGFFIIVGGFVDVRYFDFESLSCMCRLKDIVLRNVLVSCPLCYSVADERYCFIFSMFSCGQSIIVFCSLRQCCCSLEQSSYRWNP